MTEYYAEMERFIRGLNPEVAVESNPHSGISGHNTVWEQGIDYPRLLSHMDVVWTEEGNEAGVTRDGILVSKMLTEQKDQGRWLVHLLNYDTERNLTVAGIEVSLRVPPGKQVGQVSIVSPDAEGTVSAEVRASEGRAIFAVPPLRTYSVAVVQLR